jgi:hypothetical protein
MTECLPERALLTEAAGHGQQMLPSADISGMTPLNR